MQKLCAQNSLGSSSSHGYTDKNC